ncbi:37S ribosomal protein S24, mitochondrial [Spiromyces aspiralis]|uniref:37S ribosomal protein S24, mitochondrial n=1 Tax=Spiromyces aspiralis TaxID=68401 RepID=A0ACC1HW30_9FUNG|nr:37S ribosomal protein S24, mitochondrial [Spiromyces aspiralis]
MSSVRIASGATASLAQRLFRARALSTTAPILAGRKKQSYQEYSRQLERNFDMEELQTWNHDNHTTFGHLYLENVRDVRQYLRKIKYEIPTLAEYSKPFTPPSERQILRFQRTEHVGVANHPGDRRVTMTVKVSKLGLSDIERHKFLLLVGPRYDPFKDELKMSEDREPTSMENKKRLSDTLDTLIAEAKNKDDMFSDIPLTFPHAKPRKMPEFPEEWLPQQPQKQQEQQ